LRRFMLASPLNLWECYHPPNGRSVTAFAVVWRRKGLLFLQYGVTQSDPQKSRWPR